MQHGPELFDAFVSELRSAYADSVEATDGSLAVLTMFLGYTGGQRRVDVRILAPQDAIDDLGQQAIISHMLAEGLETFVLGRD